MSENYYYIFVLQKKITGDESQLSTISCSEGANWKFILIHDHNQAD